jgi:transposase
MEPQGERSQTNEVPNRASYEELLQLVAELKILVQAQAERIRQLEEENKILKKKLYGSSSERKKSTASSSRSPQSKSPGKQPRVRPLTDQYPDAEVEERYVTCDTPQPCGCCQSPLIDSGLEEITQYMHTIPARHKIIRQHRKKYKCPKCYWGLVSAALPPRIAPGSSLGDSFIFEAMIAKYYYLIPAERIAGMVSQSGFLDFPPQLVLAAQHYGAEFLRPIYVLLKQLIQARRKVLHADETPHRMLEGSDTKNWFFWGFCSTEGYYYEAHPTRSGDVASEFLAESKCENLMSDVYAGYGKAIREANQLRIKQGLAEILPLSCNAHARRKFKEAAIAYPDEAQFFIDQYEQIYRLDREMKNLMDLASRKQKRAQMRPFYEVMLERANQMLLSYPSRSSLVSALLYFTKNYLGFTRFLADPDLPIDNNMAERQLRNPVIGRKTWYGTHSERGVETAEILFSILQTCRFLKVNPRDYLQAVTLAMHSGDPPFTPNQYLADKTRVAS